MKKLYYLFLALLLPGLIFVFLKYAGSNQFDIPVYYEKGVRNLPAGCLLSQELPYVLPDSAWLMMQGERKMANVVVFPGRTEMDTDRIAEAVSEELATAELRFAIAPRVVSDSLRLSRWRSCVFLLEAPWQTVLFDSSGRIRGYYDLRSRDEVDRLRVELKILLNQY